MLFAALQTTAQPAAELSARLVTPPGAESYDQFGRVVSVDGDWMAIAEYREEVVHLYTRGEDGWKPSARLEGSLEMRAESLALVGNRLFVGSPNTRVGNASGVVFVFERVGDEWVETSVLQPTSAPCESFGAAVAADGEWLVAGCPTANTNAGAISIHRRSSGSWIEEARLMADSTALLGQSVGLVGNVLVASSNGVGDPPRGLIERSAEAIIGEFDGSSWNVTARVSPGAATVQGRVAMHGGKLAFVKTWGLMEVNNAVYVLQRSGTGWDLLHRIALPTISSPWRPKSLALYGDVLVLAEGYSCSLFDLGVNAPTATTLPTPESRRRCDAAIAVDEGIVVIGSPDIDVGDARDAGVVDLYNLQDGNATWIEAIDQGPGRNGERFGSAIAFSGLSVAAVGRRTLTVLSPDPQAPPSTDWSITHREVIPVGDRSNAALAASETHMIVAHPSGGVTVRTRLLDAWVPHTYAPAFPSNVGVSAVAMDGRRVMLGLPGQNSGRVAFFEIGDGLPLDAGQIQYVTSSEPLFGQAVALHGDVAAATSQLRTPAGYGSATLFRRDGQQRGAWVRAEQILPDAKGLFGYAAAMTDGRILITSPNVTGPTWDVGSTFVFAAENVAPVGLMNGPLGRNMYGFSIAASGDFVLVGAPTEEINGLASAGAAYLYEYANGQWTAGRRITAPRPEANARFGSALALEGRRAAISAPYEAAGSTRAGAIYVFNVSSSVSATAPARGSTFSIDVQPNPASHTVYVHIGSALPGVTTVEVFDALGRRVVQRKVADLAAESSVPLDLSGLRTGAYHVRATQADGTARGASFTIVR